MDISKLPKSQYGDGPLWINGNPVGYFLDWEKRRETEKWLLTLKQYHYAMVCLKNANTQEFEKTRNTYNQRRYRFLKNLEKNEEEIKLTAEKLGGTSLEEGSKELEKEYNKLIKLLKRKVILQTQLYETFYGTYVTGYYDLKKKIESAKIFETLQEQVGRKHIIELALSKVGTPIADRLARQQLDKAIEEIYKKEKLKTDFFKNKGGYTTIVAISRSKKTKKYKLNFKIGENDSMKLNIGDGLGVLDFVFSSYKDFIKNKEIEKPKKFIFNEVIELGTIHEIINNEAFSPEMDDYKRATAYNVMDAYRSSNKFKVQRNYLSDAIKFAYPKALTKNGGILGAKQPFSFNFNNSFLVLNGKMINIDKYLYEGEVQKNSRVKVEVMMPKLEGSPHYGRWSFKRINYIAQQVIKLKLEMNLL